MTFSTSQESLGEILNKYWTEGYSPNTMSLSGSGENITVNGTAIKTHEPTKDRPWLVLGSTAKEEEDLQKIQATHGYELRQTLYKEPAATDKMAQEDARHQRVIFVFFKTSMLPEEAESKAKTPEEPGTITGEALMHVGLDTHSEPITKDGVPV